IHPCGKVRHNSSACSKNLWVPWLIKRPNLKSNRRSQRQPHKTGIGRQVDVIDARVRNVVSKKAPYKRIANQRWEPTTFRFGVCFMSITEPTVGNRELSQVCEPRTLNLLPIATKRRALRLAPSNFVSAALVFLILLASASAADLRGKVVNRT